MRWRAAMIASGFSLVLAIPVAAQDSQLVIVQSQSSGPSRAVQSGNTTIVFAPADARDIDTARLRTRNSPIRIPGLSVLWRITRHL